jgi:hypothetical protein
MLSEAPLFVPPIRDAILLLELPGALRELEQLLAWYKFEPTTF